jgi:hypothetical protein
MIMFDGLIMIVEKAVLAELEIRRGAFTWNSGGYSVNTAVKLFGFLSEISSGFLPTPKGRLWSQPGR